jgi:formylglycine-generating enzyme required for sulfatase activity
MEYRDFAVKIAPRQGDAYPVAVESPAGEGRSWLTLPFAPGQVGRILTGLGQVVRGASGEPVRDAKFLAVEGCASAEDLGGQLFEALFCGPVRSLLDQSMGMMHGKHIGLRIKIHIDPEDPSLAQLASLPWELLYRRETRDWLNLSRFTPVVRYLDVQRPHVPLELKPPLHILVVMAQPAGCRRLDLARERTLIESNWAKLTGVEVEFLEAATPDRLADRLSARAYHVLHYMGHGDFDERTGRGVLLLEDEGGQPNAADGPTLGILLRDVPTLRLVVLNACETARLTKENGLDPFAGVASSLVMAGIPAVVAMQFPITDAAAITFARRFYTLLARGEAVDTAVAEGRRAIRTSSADTLEWGTPVLFMRAVDGVIFQVVTGTRERTGRETEAWAQSEAEGQSRSAGEAKEKAAAQERTHREDERAAEPPRRGGIVYWLQRLHGSWRIAALAVVVAAAVGLGWLVWNLAQPIGPALEKVVTAPPSPGVQLGIAASAIAAPTDTPHPTESLSSAATPLPTDTSTSAPGSTASRTATSTVVPTPPVDAVVSSPNVHLHSGPATVYDVVESYPKGTTVAVLGKNPAGDWLEVRVSDGQTGWMSIDLLEVHVPPGTVALADVPPTPTVPVAGATRVWDSDGSVMVYVPEGEFTMGSPEGEGWPDEHPQHTVYVSAFWIDRMEVTNRQYRQCVDSGGCPLPRSCDVGNLTYSDPYKAEHPVGCVTWIEARTFCQWAGKDLPTEAEWEKAARGTEGNIYPWGNEWDATKCNTSESGNIGSTPVGTFSPAGDSMYGCADMAGNVWEWVADWYDARYYEGGVYRDPTGSEEGKWRGLRGGSWSYGNMRARSTHRGWGDPAESREPTGFRCCAHPVSSPEQGPAS